MLFDGVDGDCCSGCALMLLLSCVSADFLYAITHLYMHWRLIPGLRVTIVSKLPFGAGFGSSAAYSVCLSATLLIAIVISN